ncbi:MAG: hypothetical protein F6J93_03745 [Oscillatoria sp. SIO1A7]|nr:hypothetical protein [Oscillatoria sp. SIO1A7]
MASITVNADNNTASVRIGKTEREYPINWVDDLPEFAEPVWAGVLLGDYGQKVWCGQLELEKIATDFYHLEPRRIYYKVTVSFTLNTASRLTECGWIREIVGFWDEILENKKSKKSGDPQYWQKRSKEKKDRPAMTKARIVTIGMEMWRQFKDDFEARSFGEDCFGHYYSFVSLVEDFWLKTFKEHPLRFYDDKESFLDYLQEKWAINAAIEQTAFEDEGFWLFVFEDGIFRR